MEDLFQFAAVTMPLAILLGVASGPVPWLVIGAGQHPFLFHSFLGRRDEWPAVGLSDVPEPRTIAEYLLMPFRR